MEGRARFQIQLYGYTKVYPSCALNFQLCYWLVVAQRANHLSSLCFSLPIFNMKGLDYRTSKLQFNSFLLRFYAFSSDLFPSTSYRHPLPLPTLPLWIPVRNT